MKDLTHADWFNENYLNENDFNLITDDGQYGKAESIKAKGYKTLAFNREGVSCSYSGEKLSPNVFIELKLDGGTRKAFHGIVYNKEDFLKVLQLIR